jgi:hypothetical protein
MLLKKAYFSFISSTFSRKKKWRDMPIYGFDVFDVASSLLNLSNNLFQTCQQLRASSANTCCWQAVRFLYLYYEVYSRSTTTTSPTSYFSLPTSKRSELDETFTLI